MKFHVFAIIAVITSVLNLSAYAERPAPLLAIATEKTFNVRDFGATADDGKDDLQAIRKAIEAAKEFGRPATILFPHGQYHIQLPADEKRDCILIEKARDLLIDGDGSEVILTHPRSSFIRLNECSNIIVRNFVVDYSPLPFTQGTVRAVDTESGEFDIEIAEGFLPADAPHLRPPNTGFLKDSGHPLRIKLDSENYHRNTAVKKLESGLFRFTLKNKAEIRNFAPGDRYVSQGRNSASILFAAMCWQVTCQNITVYACPAANYVGARTNALNIIGCKTLARPGRWYSSNADGVHVQSARVGPWIENCVFEAMGDDGVNIYSLSSQLRNRNDAGWLKSERFVPYLIEKGDPLVLFNPQSGLLRGPFYVTEFDAAGKQVRVNPELPADVPEAAEGSRDLVYNDALNGSGTVIRNNIFRDVRGRGILLKAHDALIEGNTFDHCSNMAIALWNNNDVPEGLLNKNVVIRHNRINNCGTDANFTRPHGQGVICVLVETAGGKIAQSQGHQNILIEHNVIEDWRRTAIAVGGAHDVTIHGNRIVNQREWNSPTDQDAAMRFENASDVTLSGNDIRDNRRISNVIVGPDCTNIHQ